MAASSSSVGLHRQKERRDKASKELGRMAGGSMKTRILLSTAANIRVVQSPAASLPFSQTPF